ncbi:MAG: UDP-N-acetylmuramoyl-L-alanine--D-glutamate ligase [Nitrospinota bacterium]|nr:UDP-N-acetylmuramoyl-L-alanine--D-glutamate ligase [Nitrospinota bacterium]
MEILVVGLGKSGIAVANYLADKNHTVTITDNKTEKELTDSIALLDKSVSVSVGGFASVMKSEYDLVVTSPGVPWEGDVLSYFREAGVTVISEIELAFTEYKRDWIAITGTNGKSTTTMLVGEMLKRGGKEAIVCGNIGNPVIGEEGLSIFGTNVVAEISSFQLEGAVTFAPKVSAILNITPDHLDRHKTLERYVELKKRVFARQTSADFCVLNMDDVTTASLSGEIPSRLFGFSCEKKMKDGVYVSGEKMILSDKGRETEICKTSEIKLIGKSGIENGAAASAIAYCAGVDIEAVREALFTFKGLPHRMELVGEYRGVRYINDSKATNVNAALKGVEGMEEGVCVILGGRDKAGDFAPLADLIRKKNGHVVLIGEAAEKIAKSFGDYKKVVNASSMAEAVKKGAELVGAGSVLLSPACASFDMFRNFEDRGDKFREAVEKIVSNNEVAHA